MLTFNLDNHAMHFQQQPLCMYELRSWLATGSIYSYVSLYFIYILYLASYYVIKVVCLDISRSLAVPLQW